MSRHQPYEPNPLEAVAKIVSYHLSPPTPLPVEEVQATHRINLLTTWAAIRPGARVLELGCGQGACTAVLAEAGGRGGPAPAGGRGARHAREPRRRELGQHPDGAVAGGDPGDRGRSRLGRRGRGRAGAPGGPAGWLLGGRDCGLAPVPRRDGSRQEREGQVAAAVREGCY